MINLDFNPFINFLIWFQTDGMHSITYVSICNTLTEHKDDPDFQFPTCAKHLVDLGQKFLAKVKSNNQERVVLFRHFVHVTDDDSKYLEKSVQNSWKLDDVCVNGMKGITDLYRFSFSNRRVVAHNTYTMKDSAKIYTLHPYNTGISLDDSFRDLSLV